MLPPGRVQGLRHLSAPACPDAELPAKVSHRPLDGEGPTNAGRAGAEAPERPPPGRQQKPCSEDEDAGLSLAQSTSSSLPGECGVRHAPTLLARRILQESGRTEARPPQQRESQGLAEGSPVPRASTTSVLTARQTHSFPVRYVWTLSWTIKTWLGKRIEYLNCGVGEARGVPWAEVPTVSSLRDQP